MLQKEDYNYYKTGKGGNETWTLHTYIKLPKRPTPNFPSQFKLPTNNMIHHQRWHSIHPHRVTIESLFLFRFVPNFTTNFVPKGIQQIKKFQPLLENPLKSNGIYQYIHPISRKRGLRKQIQDKGQIKKRKKKVLNLQNP